MAFTIAIDGPAAAGKGTISRAVAAHFGFAHLDTGLLYRAVGVRMLDGIDPVEAARALTSHDLERGDLRGAAAAQAASKVATIPEVRAHRRHAELRAAGSDMTYPEVLEDVRQRDARDRDRSTAPLKPAEDAVLIDTSALDIEAAVAAAIAAIDERRSRA